MNQPEILNMTFLENPLEEYLICLGILLFGFLLKRLFAIIISKQTFRIFRKFARNRYSEEFVILLRKPFEQLLTVLVIYFAFSRLNFPTAWHIGPESKFGLRWLIEAVFEVAVIVVLTRVLLRSADFMEIVFLRNQEKAADRDLVRFLKELGKIFIMIISFFTILGEAFEINITALVASLGIGGLAVALAAQDTIANLFGSFIIYLDKPFKVGDMVEAGEVKGTVEKIGFRTTRVRTLDKSLVTVPNKRMVDAALNNITQSVQKRVNMMIAYPMTASLPRSGISFHRSRRQSLHIPM